MKPILDLDHICPLHVVSTMVVDFKIVFRLLGAIRRDNAASAYVSYCPALKIYSQGTTSREAKEAIEEAVELFLVACFQKGILENTLKELGFTTGSGNIHPTDAARQYVLIQEANFEETFDFEVPIQLRVA
jgi:predicted RNase H-like HicB family nuclease